MDATTAAAAANTHSFSRSLDVGSDREEQGVIGVNADRLVEATVGIHCIVVNLCDASGGYSRVTETRFQW